MSDVQRLCRGEDLACLGHGAELLQVLATIRHVAGSVPGVSCGRSHVFSRAHGHPRVYFETQRTRGGAAESSGLPGPGSGPGPRSEF